MNPLDQKPEIAGGGPARPSGGLFHLSFRSGSRAGGASARAAFDYATRQDEYSGPDRDPAVYSESGHMPSWAEEDPAEYWAAADLHERANGRLYVSADFALPRDLPADAQVALAREFAEALTRDEQLPYTLAVHAGLGRDGLSHNPHAHLMFSERSNDGIARTRDAWFHRANTQHPERGGAPKSRTFHGPGWVEQARAKWADMTNAALARSGIAERVDHRSYERQGLEMEPGTHYGPAAPYVIGRGGEHDRLDDAIAVRDDAKAIVDVDQQIARLEAEREAILRGAPDEDRQQRPGDASPSSRSGQHDDQSWER